MKFWIRAGIILILLLAGTSRVTAGAQEVKLFLDGLRAVLNTNRTPALIEALRQPAPQLATAIQGLDKDALYYLEALRQADWQHSKIARALHSQGGEKVSAVADALNGVVATGQTTAVAGTISELSVQSAAFGDMARALNVMDASMVRRIQTLAESTKPPEGINLIGGRYRHVDIDLCEFYDYVEFMCAVKQIVEEKSTEDPAMTARLEYAKQRLSERWVLVDVGLGFKECAMGADACGCFEALKKSAYSGCPNQ